MQAQAVSTDVQASSGNAAHTTTVARNRLDGLGLARLRQMWWNLPVPALYEHAIGRDEGLIAEDGPLVVSTGKYTGRSPDDKFIVREPESAEKVHWGRANRPFDPDRFERLYRRVLAYLQGRDVFVQDCFAGADPAYRLPLRVITESAWQSLFARNLFIRPTAEELAGHEPQFTVLSTPGFQADPDVDGTNSEAFVVLSFARRLLLVSGTNYAGEIKKSVFTVLNYLLPIQGVLSMHASANVGPKGDAAVFFGLSGTGKTTLSTDPARALIGDDEHGWSDTGVFNFEGGCYAKVIRLSPRAEPEIYATTRRFGTVLENVVADRQTRRLDLDDESLTENTRGAYPIGFIPNADPSGRAGHPRTILMLTADAFGVLPPISRLNPAQAMYHFLSGYTAKVAGTERGVTEPEATFSTCFGEPFLVLPPATYARMLGERIEQHGVRVWLVNTGWSGGPYGAGQRMPIAYTRAMVRAALEGELDDVPTVPDPIFGVGVPTQCPHVPDAILRPRSTWTDPVQYDRYAHDLARRFADNFAPFAGQVPPEVRAAGPRV
ncbi:MAG: phosphoenolpyruvate carboxykinase (ATP) [Chloroflexi bacterium]|nr:phosphoenolpyruvate carboxykinase (ATP) [Chloroflexota bacterium]